MHQVPEAPVGRRQAAGRSRRWMGVSGGTYRDGGREAVATEAEEQPAGNRGGTKVAPQRVGSREGRGRLRQGLGLQQLGPPWGMV